MSKTVCVYPIISALHKAYEVGNGSSPWVPTEREQQRYLDNGEKWEQELALLTPDELETVASFDANDLNAFFKSKGLDIVLSPFSGPDDFGTGSVMKVVTKWLTAGRSTYLTRGEEMWAAAQLSSGITYTSVGGYANPIASIQTESGDSVRITKADDTSLNDLDLLAKVILLSGGQQITDFGDLIFPKVKHNAAVDISFFKGMGFKGRRRSGGVDFCRVKEAKAQTKLEMDHLGAKAESGAGMSMAFECFRPSKPSLVINETFYVWMNRKGMSAPYFAGCIDSGDWKDPNPN